MVSGGLSFKLKADVVTSTIEARFISIKKGKAVLVGQMVCPRVPVVFKEREEGGVLSSPRRDPIGCPFRVRGKRRKIKGNGEVVGTISLAVGQNRVGDGRNAAVGPDGGPNGLRVRHIEPIKPRSAAIGRVDVGMGVLTDLFEAKVKKEGAPKGAKIKGGVVIWGLRGRVFVFVFDKIKVAREENKPINGNMLLNEFKLFMTLRVPRAGR